MPSQGSIDDASHRTGGAERVYQAHAEVAFLKDGERRVGVHAQTLPVNEALGAVGGQLGFGGGGAGAKLTLSIISSTTSCISGSLRLKKMHLSAADEASGTCTAVQV